MRGLFVFAILLVTLGSAWFFISNNPAVMNQVTNFIPGASQPVQTETTVGEGSVSIKGFKYTPETITVKVGDTVTWTNSDSVAHTATADDGSWDTGSIGTGESKEVIFTKAGTFSYHCTPHPFMKGKVVVTE